MSMHQVAFITLKKNKLNACGIYGTWHDTEGKYNCCFKKFNCRKFME